MSYIKQFNTVGVSRMAGEVKIRMANDIEWRTFMLTKEGHTDIQLVDLGETMSKPDAVKRAMSLPEFADNAEAQACFVTYLQAQGLIERPKKPRGRPAKAQLVAEAEAPAVASTFDELAPALQESLIDAVGEFLSKAAETTEA